MPSSNNKRTLIIGVIVAATVVFLAILGWQKTGGGKLEVESVTPINGSSVQPTQTKVVFTFSKPLDTKKPPDITVSPLTEYKSSINDNVLTISLGSELENNTTYSIILQEIKSRGRQAIDVYSTSFSVKDTSPAGKFKASLPLDTTEYNLEYFADQKEFYVITRTSNLAAIKASVEDRLRKNGINPRDYKITYDDSSTSSEGGELDADYTGDGVPPEEQ